MIIIWPPVHLLLKWPIPPTVRGKYPRLQSLMSAVTILLWIPSAPQSLMSAATILLWIPSAPQSLMSAVTILLWIPWAASNNNRLHSILMLISWRTFRENFLLQSDAIQLWELQQSLHDPLRLDRKSRTVVEITAVSARSLQGWTEKSQPAVGITAVSARSFKGWTEKADLLWELQQSLHVPLKVGQKKPNCCGNYSSPCMLL